jgi:hypothetical protein
MNPNTVFIMSNKFYGGNMPRYAPLMTVDELKTMVVTDAVKRNYEEEYTVIDHNSPDFALILGMLLGGCFDSEDDEAENKESTLMDKVHADWSKVQFDLENYEVEGFELTDTGVPYVMMTCGGDWEVPIACVIYWDGKHYRGYVPVEGNCYNVKAKAAFGNADEDDDQRAFKAQFGDKDMYDAEPDWVIVRNAVSGRIEGRGTATANKAPVKSNAKLKAERQAAIETSLDLTGDITADMVYAVIGLAAGCAHVAFILRASGRELTKAECNRVVGMPSTFRKSEGSTYIVWYSPNGIYPQRAEILLKASGFTKDPKNDISHYNDHYTTRVVYI